MDLLIAWLLTAISLLIIAQLPIGVEIDNFGKALVAAIVFGILNAIVKPVLLVLTIPITILTLGIFLIILNAIIFGLAAALVQGFRLRYGFWSAIFGSVFLSIVNGLLNQVVSR
ncbi:membrane protein of unknown function [Rippkaea orientalis PCC 8801]|uniref:Phage holin family protein n=1 Tax=Rippkaea orientalis (strain PCC 8801 / RF-1) TaxID=41431 RepID=B7JYY3_RIPO1|nr:phage holin family protein [Rippkaea orientalis]ACK66060.1 membrane protein of unknown function [Rippkaea orientalis PCC 8801]